MNLNSILQPEAVKVVSDISSKKRLLQLVAEMAASLTKCTASEVCCALLERENLGPTGFGNGVALPHARLSGIDQVTGAFIKLDRPVNYEAVDHKPVDLVFALFAPEDGGTEHLKALAMVSRTLRDKTLCERLRANSDPAAQFELLTDLRAPQLT